MNSALYLLNLLKFMKLSRLNDKWQLLSDIDFQDFKFEVRLRT